MLFWTCHLSGVLFAALDADLGASLFVASFLTLCVAWEEESNHAVFVNFGCHKESLFLEYFYVPLPLIEAILKRIL